VQQPASTPFQKTALEFQGDSQASGHLNRFLHFPTVFLCRIITSAISQSIKPMALKHYLGPGGQEGRQSPRTNPTYFWQGFDTDPRHAEQAWTLIMSAWLTGDILLLHDATRLRREHVTLRESHKNLTVYGVLISLFLF
jgi:hypothetical protein